MKKSNTAQKRKSNVIAFPVHPVPTLQDDADGFDINKWVTARSGPLNALLVGDVLRFLDQNGELRWLLIPIEAA